MIGKTVSHYAISDKLGEGGMGVVYKAEDTKLRRTVALKFLPPQTMGTGEEKERFIREAQAAAALDHPSICTTYEIDEADGHTFISMAYLDGRSLKETIRSGPLDQDETIKIAIQVAEGLQEAHEKHIVHRDIKSGNIMITRKGQAKIMDFGLARLSGRTRLTKTATVMGTVDYMSPEQAAGKTVDHRTDIWSLGVVLYEMLTGKLPFTGTTDVAVIHNIIYENPLDLKSLAPNVHAGLATVVARALAKQKEDRYATISDLLNDLRSYRTVLPYETPVRTAKAPEADLYAIRKAERRVKAKMRFYVHLAIFGAINGLLFFINLFTGIKSLWFIYPFLALCVPLGIHAAFVFALSRHSEVRDRMIEKEVSKILLNKK